MITKIIISNESALTNKYGSGMPGIRAAIRRWILQDAARGISAQYIPLDDAAAMATLGSRPVLRWNDEVDLKRAFDDIDSHHHPDYIVILGSVDVIPHQSLVNPVPSDLDSDVPSDLPYACNVRYSRNIGEFVGPTRVLSRLPDITNDGKAENLVHLIDMVSSAHPNPVSFYMGYLGVSASVWSVSTRLNLLTLFGSSAAQQDVPPAGSPWPHAMLSKPSHFFNCHGAPADGSWYGQLGGVYPIANRSTTINGKITQGTVVAAECCYGAQLFDPALAGEMPICNSYMQSGAFAFWGSSNIAYGPASSNDNADLICQYFFDELLKGASNGRAALLARQRYARKTLTLSPVDLKTLAQFMVFGDASTTCVGIKTVSELSAKSILTEAMAEEQEKKQRRMHMAVDGEQLSKSRAISLDAISMPSERASEMSSLATKFGILEPKMSLLRVVRKQQVLAASAAGSKDLQATQISEFCVIKDTTETPSYKLLEVALSGSDIIFVKELYSR